MLRFLFALLTFALLPLSANAISTASIISTNCSGNLTTSLLDGASFACAGNLTLDGGFVTSDSLINISADGDLFVDNLTLTAPNITFSNTAGLLTIGSSVVINTSTAVVQSKPESTLTWNKLNIANGSGAVLSIGAGGDLKVGTGIGYVLTGNNIPVVGGSIFLNSDSGALVNAGAVLGAVLNEPSSSITAVPEPSTYAMMLLGVFCLMNVRRKTI